MASNIFMVGYDNGRKLETKQDGVWLPTEEILVNVRSGSSLPPASFAESTFSLETRAHSTLSRHTSLKVVYKPKAKQTMTWYDPKAFAAFIAEVNGDSRDRPLRGAIEGKIRDFFTCFDDEIYDRLREHLSPNGKPQFYEIPDVYIVDLDDTLRFKRIERREHSGKLLSHHGDLVALEKAALGAEGKAIAMVEV
ncbi:hypothetical protein LZ30DRAFT_685019 [Colletotrichum cereale]|nr:hypothetical protein LZ30DRAFT_685019 [Colletotrichum cereale]